MWAGEKEVGALENKISRRRLILTPRLETSNAGIWIRRHRPREAHYSHNACRERNRKVADNLQAFNRLAIRKLHQVPIRIADHSEVANDAAGFCWWLNQDA